MNYFKILSTRSLFLLTLLCLTVLVAFSEKVFAQTTNRYELSYQTIGKTNDVTTSSINGQAAHQIFLDEEGSSLLTVAVNFSDTSLKDDELSGEDKTRSLKTFIPNLSLMKILDDEYSLIVYLRPGLYGDLEGDLGNDFRLEGGAVVTKYMSDQLTMGLGVGRGSNLGRDMVVPLLQFVYFANSKVVARGVLPVRASVWYIPDQKWEFGALFRLEGALYNIEESDIADVEQLGFAAATIGGGARYNLGSNNFLSMEAGITAMRRYEFNDEREILVMRLDYDPFEDKELDRAPYLRLGWIQKF